MKATGLTTNYYRLHVERICTNTMGRCQILRHTEKADKRVRKLIFIIVSKLEG